MVFLDSAATTFPHQDCLDMFNDCMVNYYNPSSTYCEVGRDAKLDVDNARSYIAEYINASSDEIYFTSSGSEANTWAIRGLVEANDIDVIITTKIEHSSVWNAVNYISKNNGESHKYQTCHVEYVDTFGNGQIKSKHFKELLQKWEGHKILVAIMYANNEIGVIQNIDMLSLLTHMYDNTWFFTDAVQAFGNIDIDMKYLKYVDAMSVSGHKVGMMSGIGFLYVKNGIKISPLIFGGNQERHLRGGTENYGYINAFGIRVKFLGCEKNIISREILHKKKLYFKKCIDENLYKQKIDGWYYNDDPYYSLDHIISLTIKGVDAQQLISFLEMYGFVVSAGSACNSGNNEPSRVLKAVGLSDEDAKSTIRICPDVNVKDIDVERFAEALGIGAKILSENNNEKVDADE